MSYHWKLIELTGASKAKSGQYQSLSLFTISVGDSDTYNLSSGPVALTLHCALESLWSEGESGRVKTLTAVPTPRIPDSLDQGLGPEGCHFPGDAGDVAEKL